MNRKKILASVMAGAMVLGSFTVPVTAAATDEQNNYVNPRKLVDTGAKMTSGKLDNVSLGTWWTPEKFSDSLQLTKNYQLTINYDVTMVDPSVSDPWPSFLLFYSKTGGAYGGTTGDLSYYKGVDNDMVEFVTVYENNGYTYDKTGKIDVTGGWVENSLYDNEDEKCGLTIERAPWGVDEDTGKIINDYEEYEDWDTAWKTNGATATIKAKLLDDTYARVRWELAAKNSKGAGGAVPTMIGQIIFKYKNSKDTSRDKAKGVYICLNGNPQKADNMKFTNINYEYKDVESTTLSLNKTSSTYTGKDQKSAIKYTIKDSKGNDVTSKYTKFSVVFNKAEKDYASANFTDAGVYTIKAHTDDEEYDSDISTSFTMNKASQSITVVKKKSGQTYKVTKTLKKTQKKTKKLSAKQLKSLKSSDKKTWKKLKKTKKVNVTKKKVTYSFKVSGASTGTYVTSLSSNAPIAKILNKKLANKNIKVKNGKLSVTFPKGTPAGVYKFTVRAQQSANYNQSKDVTVQLTLK